VADQILEKFFGYIQRESIHGPGHVHDEDIFARGNLLHRDPLGRLNHQKKEVFLLPLVQKHPRLDSPPGKPIPQNEIAVPAVALRGIQTDGNQPGAFVGDIDLVGCAGYVLNRYAGAHIRSHVEGCLWGLALVKVRIGDPPVLWVFGYALIGIAGTHNRRIDKLIDAFPGNQQLCVAEFHPNLIAGQDIRNTHLKYIGSVLLQKRSTLSILSCLLVLASCLLPLLDGGRYNSLSDDHLHPVNRGPGGSRKDVDSFQRLLSLVCVHLGDDHVCDYTRDGRVDGCGLERQSIHTGVLAFYEEIGGEGLFTLIIQCMSTDGQQKRQDQ